MRTSSRYERTLTDQGLLAQTLGLLEILLPLEDTKSLVDQRQHIDCSRFGLALHLNSLVKLLNRPLVVLLVEEKLAIVVVNIRHIFKLLHRALECSHSRRNGAELVLCHTELDMGVDERWVEVN